ncbi:MAG: hypothetical protein IJB09_04280 [Oscillospiraceae bacterium]|nr:hypothetical protein [Oscillospiraceae bacterium]
MIYSGDNKQLHDEIKSFMKENGILEQDICNVLGKTRQNLSTIFNRMNHGDDPDLYTLYRLAKGMGYKLKIDFVKE